MSSVILKLINPDSQALTVAERWFMGNGVRYEASPDNPLMFRLSSEIPGFQEQTEAFFRANFIKYALYDEAGNLIDEAPFYQRAYLQTPAAELIASRLGGI